ncbi:hypothetical protein BD626DRAFT_91304 [Schizophyllum amplum]|uniref:Uncharacterized protein n=1 Tax=Schizophyllum amplum TaxID=97359 RepID=A0A550C8P9_9AGAR|nr:hypothetical protein BD626DRAFT_91304 [Auriculariopsis ampla]
MCATKSTRPPPAPSTCRPIPALSQRTQGSTSASRTCLARHPSRISPARPTVHLSASWPRGITRRQDDGGFVLRRGVRTSAGWGAHISISAGRGVRTSTVCGE